MKEMYISLSGAMAQERHLSVVANNLANVNSAGFKREVAIFEVLPPQVRYDAMEQSASPELGLPPITRIAAQEFKYNRIAATPIDFSSGEIRVTNNPMDVALHETNPGSGVAFFAVDTPEGVRYTRMGNFVVNAQQHLVTPSGLRVLDSGNAPIQLPDGAMSVSPTGEISSNGQQAGAFRVVVFENPAALERIGNGLYADPEGAAQGRPADGDVLLRQGMLESSNVNIVSELIRMIELQRSFNAQQKVLSSIDDVSSRMVTFAING